MAFAGALCAPAFAASVLGSPDAALSVTWVVTWGIAGSMVGSWLAYGLGAWGGRPAIDRWGRYLLLRPHEVDRAHAWFERRGEAVVFLGRLVPLIRAFVSLPAGVARMDLRRFTIFTLFGVIPWCLGLALAGRALGADFKPMTTSLTGAPDANGANTITLDLRDYLTNRIQLTADGFGLYYNANANAWHSKLKSDPQQH